MNYPCLGRTFLYGPLRIRTLRRSIAYGGRTAGITDYRVCVSITTVKLFLIKEGLLQFIKTIS